jgi:hypothetical protein
MEIKIAEIFEKENDLKKVCEQLQTLILGKEIQLFEYDDEEKDYDFVGNYKVQSIDLWEDDQIALRFGPSEWDVCSIMETDLIKIND